MPRAIRVLLFIAVICLVYVGAMVGAISIGVYIGNSIKSNNECTTIMLDAWDDVFEAAVEDLDYTIPEDLGLCILERQNENS